MQASTFIVYLIIVLFFLYRVKRFVGKRIHERRLLKIEPGIDKETFDRRKRFFGYEILFAIAGWAVGSLSLFLGANKVDYLIYHFEKDHKPGSWYESVLYHFDATGVIIGVVGIIVGLLIFVAAENNNQKNNIQLTNHLNELSAATVSIQKTNTNEEKQLEELKKLTAEIKSYLTYLNQHRSLSARLDGIKGVIEHAKEFGNKLYVLTYGPVYGQLLMSNLDILVNEGAQSRDLSAMTYNQFYTEFISPLQEKINENRTTLIELCNNKSLKLSLLRNPAIDPFYADKFRQFVEKRVVDKKKILFFDPTSDSLITEQVLTDGSKISERKSTYIHCTTQSFKKPVGDLEKTNIFIDSLLDKNKEAIESLKDNAEITCLDYVPFQFYVSCPETPMVNSAYLALVIFTNYYDVAQDNGVVSFTTQSDDLCIGLKKMFEGLVKTQEEKDKNTDPLKSVFKLDKQSNYPLRILLKNISVNDKQQGLNTYTQVTPVADNKAKDDFLAFFKSNEINHTSDVQYLKKDDLDSFIKNIPLNKYTFLSVGLFHNPLSEIIGNLKRPGNDLSLQQQTYLYKLNDPDDPALRKTIEIADSGNIYIPRSLTYKTFTETFSPDQGVPGQWDFAMFVKQKIRNKWIFIGGGINYFGSENLINCLAEEHTTFIGNDIKPDEQFAAVFKIHNDSKATAELVFLSKVDNDGLISVVSYSYPV